MPWAKGGIGNDGYSQLLRRFENAVSLDPSIDQTVAHLVADQRQAEVLEHLMGLPHLTGREIADTDRPDLPLFLDIGHGLHLFLDAREAGREMDLVQIYGKTVEVFEPVIDGLVDRRCKSRKGIPLGGNDHVSGLDAVRFQGVGQGRLGGSPSVHLGRVEPVNAFLQRDRHDFPDLFGLQLAPVAAPQSLGFGELPASKADGRHLDIGLTESDSFHRLRLPLIVRVSNKME